VPDESVVEEGLGSMQISRRRLIKAGAIVGGTVWVAPVIDSFTSRAAAASEQHFCCCCTNPKNPNALTFQCESDGIPSSQAACISFCQSIIAPAGANARYQNFQWCGPASTGWATSGGTCSGPTAPCVIGSVPQPTP
jgi:hypothetical protein